jgi:hypothetical protein
VTSRATTAALEKLCKWRKFFASWQLGTRTPDDGELRAVSSHREATILLRAEVTALAYLLISKDLITETEWDEALARAAADLDQQYEQSFPGWSATSRGLAMKLPEALETTRRLGFPP